ncbi:GNAT family N-acetyltransferase [Halochromatium salexigens]|uniref:GNAT family N-acetyltransferase n=1 Tax=Halochromatium salexigens TaxID=49447 RepID=A0AAJ0UF04_HALSE|nr:GNAT family N-acetyltransferase [Halochromatium salexigens]MBK5929690.1 GNAT family N-acetyltransferase [Halochromatium salexigens]
MTENGFDIVPLKKQDRAAFSCGVEALDRYLKTQATQDMRRLMSSCYVALDRQTEAIAGYYTLSAGDVLLSGLPESLIRRLPRYPAAPVARIGRLAVDQRYQGRKLGGALLLNAAMRAVRSEVAVFALVVDAKDDKAADFYRHYQFSAFDSDPLRLVAPLETFRKLLG